MITEENARRAQRNTLYDLGSSDGAGPHLFLDGSIALNPASTQLCWGWLVPPLSKPARKTLEAEVGSSEPPAKKSKSSPEAMATHEIISQHVLITVRHGVEQTTLTYKAPSLVDVLAKKEYAAAANQTATFRKRTAMDDIEWPKSDPQIVTKVAASFLTS